MIHLLPTDISKISSALRSGQVVALPTETVFGLAISLDSPTALEKLIYLKKRDISSGKVFTLVPDNPSRIPDYAQLTRTSRALIAKYFPGELTLILKKNPSFSHPYFDHFLTIGVRIPRHPLFDELLKVSGPLLLTSANPRGDTPAPDSATVERTMSKVDILIDGKSGAHLPSTIVSFASRTPVVVRQGSLVIPTSDLTTQNHPKNPKNPLKSPQNP